MKTYWRHHVLYTQFSRKQPKPSIVQKVKTQQMIEEILLVW